MTETRDMVVWHVETEPGYWTLATLADELELYRSAVAYHLRPLQEQGVLLRDPPGMVRLLDLEMWNPRRLRRREVPVARAMMEQLVEVGGTVSEQTELGPSYRRGLAALRRIGVVAPARALWPARSVELRAAS